jgi:hypothetical protein
VLRPGLDPLGDGDLALARQQFHRAHLAQVHAHRVVGAVELFGARCRPERDLARFGSPPPRWSPLLLVLGLFILDDVDAHLGEHRHHVLDLFGRDLIGRQNLVELVVGDVALLAASPIIFLTAAWLMSSEISLGHRQYPFVLGANHGVRIASPLHLQPYLARISDSHRPSSAFLRLPGLV